MGAESLRPDDPDRLGGYELLGRLGQGGQGAVYLGRSESGGLVAIKWLREEVEAQTPARERFFAEAAAARRVARFCTAQVLDVGLADQRPFIVSEYVAGPSLRQAVADAGPFRGGALERLAVGTATALAAIHDAGIVHRDFKPNNVLIGPDGPRVIDFGVARALEATLTTSPHLVGSPNYMAPEQIRGEPVGPASDMFAWGATMVFAASGKPPFGHSSIPTMFHQILHADPDLGPLSGTLRETVITCLDKDPYRRPTAHQVLRRLFAGDEDTVPTGGLTLAAELIGQGPVDGPGRRPRTPPGAANGQAVDERAERRSRIVRRATVMAVGAFAIVIAVAATERLAGRAPTLTWRPVPDLAIYVDSPGVAVLGGDLWVVGGLLPQREKILGPATDRVFVYDPDTARWRSGPSLPLPLDHVAVASDGQRLYVVGGETDTSAGKSVRKSVYVLDAVNPTWRPGPPLPEPRTEGAAAWDGQRLVFAGGVASGGGPARTDVWTLQGSGWRKLGDLPVGRQHLAAASDGNGRTWFIGGRNRGTRHGSLELVVGSDIRPYAQVAAASSPAAVWHPDAGVCQLGGHTSQGATDKVTCLTEGSRNDPWPPLPQPRYGAGAAVLGDAAYVVGGLTPDGSTRVDALQIPRRA